MGGDCVICWIVWSGGISCCGSAAAVQTVFALPLSVSLSSLSLSLSFSVVGLVSVCGLELELELGLELELNWSGMAEHMHGVTETKAKY